MLALKLITDFNEQYELLISQNNQFVNREEGDDKFIQALRYLR